LPAPTLIEPAVAAATNNTKPVFTWNYTALAGTTYEFQLSKAPSFSPSSILKSYVGPNLTYTYLPDATSPQLAEGKYYWHVRALNSTAAVTGAWSVYRVLTIDTTAPLAPKLSLPANAASVAFPVFSWASSLTAAKYKFEYDNNPSFIAPLYTSSEITTLYHTPTVVMTLGSYYWRVLAADAAGNWSLPSAARTVTILPAPVLVTPLSGGVLTTRTPNFTWSSVTAGDAYQLQISSATSFAASAIRQTFTGAPDVLTYTAITDLTDGVYYWRARVSPSGTWSVYRAFTVDATPPTVPTLSLPAAAASMKGTPNFTWKIPATTAKYKVTKYQFEYDVLADFSSSTGPAHYTSGELATTSFKPPTMSLGKYYWHVRGKDSAGIWGAYSAAREVNVTPLALSGVSILVSPANSSVIPSPTPTLSWGAIAGAFSYQVQLDKHSTFGAPLVIPLDFDSVTPLTSITVTTLPDGTYYWRVRRVDIYGGAGAWSAVWRLSVNQPIPLAVTASALSALSEPIASNTPTFTWNSAKYGVTYQIQVDSKKDFSAPLFDDTANTTSRTLRTPLPDGEYFWRVRAINIYKTPGPWSETWTIKVNAP
jgi:hypothetical protein